MTEPLSALASLGALAGCATTPQAARIRPITRGPKFHWRGYYDKFLFSADDRFVLANEVDFQGRSPTTADSIRVGMVDTQDGDRWIDLGGSDAWNWQQGCMLQWVPGSDRDVAWNDREGGRFVTRGLDVNSGRTRTLPPPFYTFSPDGKTAFAPDFGRLDDERMAVVEVHHPYACGNYLEANECEAWAMWLELGWKWIMKQREAT
jgi:hypothetical protein